MMMRQLRKGEGTLLPQKRNGPNPYPDEYLQRRLKVVKEKAGRGGERGKKRAICAFFSILEQKD